MSVRLTCAWAGVEGQQVCLTLRADDDPSDPLNLLLAYREGYTTAGYLALALSIPGWEFARDMWFVKHGINLVDLKLPDDATDWDALEVERLRRAKEEAKWEAIGKRANEESDAAWRRFEAENEAKKELQRRNERTRKMMTARVLSGEKIDHSAPQFIPDNDRSRRAWGMRQAGATYKCIGETVGVSIERARQIVFQYERRMIRATEAEWEPVYDEAAYDVWHTFTHDGRVTNI